MTAKQSNPSTPDRAEQTRKAILAAAIREFSAHGFSGARTEAIAAASGANKALLYYYFKSKQGLYEAAIEAVSAGVVADALAALNPKYSPGERLLRTALNHFDRILTKREFQSLLQQEMVRFRLHSSEPAPMFFRTAFEPLLEKLNAAIDEGIRTRELCKVDRLQIQYVIFGANAFYFLSAPMMQQALSFDPLSIESLEARRNAVVSFLGKAIFTDRARGARLAARVLRQMPMPPLKNFQLQTLPARSKLA
jgi:TetR/AcrR family transcriptional regulator